MIWDFDSFWAKARIYAARASGEDREDAVFPLWSMLTLEMIGRAVLASVHPALVADPRDGENIMYAFGYDHPKTPKTIVAKTVFVRCAQIVESFTEEDARTATALIEMRNEELHSGSTRLAILSTSAWLVDYYRLCRTLLSHLALDLKDLLDEEDAAAADRLLEASSKQTLGDVKRSIAAHKVIWEDLSPDERTEKVAAVEERLGKIRSSSRFGPDTAGTAADCPACSVPGWITGEVVRSGEPRAGEDEILQTFTKLPTRFECFACGLSLTSEAQVQAAKLDGLYNVEIGEDPASFYGIDPAESTDWDDYDYGND